MKQHGALYSNLRVYGSRDFLKFNADEVICLTEQSEEKKEESKEITFEINREGGDREI